MLFLFCNHMIRWWFELKRIKKHIFLLFNIENLSQTIYNGICVTMRTKDSLLEDKPIWEM